MTTPKLDTLISIYAEEQQLFDQMLALAEEQAKCVASGNFTVLVEILERRQRLSAEVDAISQQVQAAAQELAQELALPEVNVTNLRQRLPEATVAPLAAALEQLRQTAEAIMKIDARSESEIKQVMQGLRGEMSDVQRGQTAMRAYKNAPQPNDARFIDKQR